MNLLGITLRRPPYREFTAASIMGVGLWTLLMALAQVAGRGLAPAEAVALLVMTWWSCVAVRCGIDLARGGWRHWAAHGGVAFAMLVVNEAAWALVG